MAPTRRYGRLVEKLNDSISQGHTVEIERFAYKHMRDIIRVKRIEGCNDIKSYFDYSSQCLFLFFVRTNTFNISTHYILYQTIDWNDIADITINGERKSFGEWLLEMEMEMKKDKEGDKN